MSTRGMVVMYGIAPDIEPGEPYPWPPLPTPDGLPVVVPPPMPVTLILPPEFAKALADAAEEVQVAMAEQRRAEHALKVAKYAVEAAEEVVKHAQTKYIAATERLVKVASGPR